MGKTVGGVVLAVVTLLCLYPAGITIQGIAHPMENIVGQHDEAAELQISVSGGLGVRITVTNAGIAALYNLSWRMSVSGPLCIDSDVSGTAAVLEPGKAFTVALYPVGLGPASLVVEVDDMTASTGLWLLGPFTLGV